MATLGNNVEYRAEGDLLVLTIRTGKDAVGKPPKSKDSKGTRLVLASTGWARIALPNGRGVVLTCNVLDEGFSQ